MISRMEELAFKVEKLSPEQRLRLLERLWDSLAHNPEDIPLTPAQKQELDSRLDSIDDEGPTGIPWENVLRRLQNSGS